MDWKFVETLMFEIWWISSEAARREMRQLVMLVCVWRRREALAAVQEAIHISQEMNDPVCLQHALVCTLGTMTLTCPSVCVCVCCSIHITLVGGVA